MPRLPRLRLDPAVLLVALLVAVNVLAVIGLVAARRDARTAVRESLELETRADARAFEARLASEHAGLDFLARSAPFAALPNDDGDPVARRWARLDIEATLLLYLRSSPAVVGLRVVAQGEGLALARRDDGVPTLDAPDGRTPGDPDLLRATWPLDPGGELQAWLDPRPLVADLGDHLALRRVLPTAPPGLVEPVSSRRWTPPLDGWLERSEGDSPVLGAVERLASFYRTTLVLNVALLPVTLLLGALTVRRVRGLASLESERRQRDKLLALELQVQHAERLAGLGRFAAGAAHEINNPLEGMANYLQLLREDLDAGRVAEAREWLPRLDEGIDRVAGTVRQMLHFAEPGATEHRPLDLAEVIERTVLFLRRHPECRDADLRVDCPGSVPVEGDPVGLGQLLLNLLLNACQATTPGDPVDLVVTCGSDSATSDIVVVDVLDRGPGVPDELRDRVFEPFQSGRGSSGLGLAVCHGIVTGHHGRIELVDRQPGPGTRVHVELPRRAAEPSGDSR